MSLLSRKKGAKSLPKHDAGKTQIPDREFGLMPKWWLEGGFEMPK